MTTNIFEALGSPQSQARWSNLDYLGPMFFTPGQAAFRHAAQGWDGDAAQYGDRQGHHPMHKLTYNNYDGTCQMNGLDATESGWIDSGGDNGRVTGAGRY